MWTGRKGLLVGVCDKVGFVRVNGVVRRNLNNGQVTKSFSPIKNHHAASVSDHKYRWFDFSNADA